MNASQHRVATAKAQGRRPPRTIPEADFQDAFLGSSASRKIVSACRAIMVEGEPWEATCELYGVSMGGVWKALNRHLLR